MAASRSLRDIVEPDATFIFCDDAHCYAYAYAFYGDCVYMHVEIRRWSLSLLKIMRREWKGILERFKSLGLTRVYTYPEDDCETFRNFCACFGFNRIGPLNGEVKYEHG